MTEEEEAEVDSYLIDLDDAAETLGESVKDHLLMWLGGNLGVDWDKAKKIVGALFTWSLLHVRLRPHFDAVVTTYQGHPTITESIPRKVIVNDITESDEDLLDQFDPMIQHMKTHKDPSNFFQ